MNFIQKWAVNLFRIPEQPKEVKYTHVKSVELTLAEWRKDGKYVSAAQQLARQEAYALQLQCLTNEHPVHKVLALGVSPNDRLVHQARIEGYEMCLNNLAAFRQPLKSSESLESSFEPEQTLNQKAYARTHRA